MNPVQRIQVGEPVRPFTLPSITEEPFELSGLHGRRFMLAFMRFASCPFCNLRIHDLVSHFEAFGPDFTIVALFDSPLDNLVRHAKGHDAPFPILADEGGIVHRAYGIEHSMAGVLKGMVFRAPTLMRAMFSGYVPGIPHGSMTTMPADLLVDEAGTVQCAYYGRDEGDHLPLEEIISFSRRDKT